MALIVSTSERQPQAGEVRASIFVTSPVAKAMLRSSKNSCAVARTPAAMSLEDRAAGSEAAEVDDVPAVVGLEAALELTAADGATEGDDTDATGLADAGLVAAIG